MWSTLFFRELLGKKTLLYKIIRKKTLLYRIIRKKTRSHGVISIELAKTGGNELWKALVVRLSRYLLREHHSQQPEGAENHCGSDGASKVAVLRKFYITFSVLSASSLWASILPCWKQWKKKLQKWNVITDEGRGKHIGDGGERDEEENTKSISP